MGKAPEFCRRVVACVFIITVTLFVVAAVSWTMRLPAPSAIMLGAFVITILVSFYVHRRRQYVRGYDLFWKGVHFERTWSRPQITGWCDAMMDRDEDVGPAR